MEGANNEDDERLSQLNVELDVNDHNPSVITTINEEVALVNERNGPAKSVHSVESTSENRGGFSKVVHELKSHDNKVLKCCPDGLCDAVGKHLARNEQLSERETELRRRLAALECWIPTLIKILTGEVDPSKIHHPINEQTMSASTSNAHLHASLSQHEDSRIGDIEAERKEAHRRLEMARKLLLEKQSTIDERANQIEEAEGKHTSLEQKIGQLEEQFEHEDVHLMNVTSRESVDSFGHDHLGCIMKLEELVASEEHTKRQLEELERKEEVYINTLIAAGQIMQRNKKHPDVDELRGQLQVKSKANQQMADRIVFLEDQVENLKDRLARCNDYVERLRTGDTIQLQSTMDSSATGGGGMKKKLIDRAILTAPINTVTVAAGSNHDTVKRRNRGVFATVRSNSKETLTRVELTDRSVQEAMADNRRQNQNQLLRDYDNDDNDNNIILIEPLNVSDETMYPNSFSRIAHEPPALPSIDESHASAMNTPKSTDKSTSTSKKRKTHGSDRSNRADKSTHAKLSRHVDSTFRSLPSQINDSDWTTFSDINKTVEPTGTNQRPQYDNVSFVSLQSTIASDSDEAAMRPISKDGVNRGSPRPIQTGEVEYDQGNTSVPAFVPSHRPNNRKYVSLKSNVDESAWSTFSNLHESGSSEGDKRPPLRQGGVLVPPASTLPHTSVDQIEDIAAPRRPLVRTVIDPNLPRQDQPTGEIQTERIAVTRMELEMWLHNINDIRRHISRCPICVSKKRALVLMCKAICHYLWIQFNVCTDINENDTAAIAAREGEVYTIHNGVLRRMIGKGISSREKRDEQLLTNEIESNRSPRKDSMIESAPKYNEIPSIDESIGVPIGMSTGIHNDYVRSPAKRIQRGQRSPLRQQADSLPHDRVIDRSADKSTFTGGEHLGQHSLVPVDSVSHDRAIDSAVDRAKSNRGKHLTQEPREDSSHHFQMVDVIHYEETPSMDTIAGVPIGTSTPKRKVPIDEKQTKSAGKSNDSDHHSQMVDVIHYEEAPSMDTIAGVPIGTSTPKRKVLIDEKQQTKSAGKSNDSDHHSRVFDVIHYEEPPSMNTIAGVPIGTSTPKRKVPIDELRQTKSSGESNDSEENAQMLNETSYMTVGTYDQEKFTPERIREHGNSREKRIEMNLESSIYRTKGKKRWEKSGTRHDITHSARILQNNLSDDEFEYDSRSEDDESMEQLRMDEEYRQDRREKNRKITGKVKIDDRVYSKSLGKKGMITHIDDPSISGQSTSYVQPIPEGPYCTCDITRQFPKMTRDCFAGSSAPIRRGKIDDRHEKQTRRHGKNEKMMETPVNIEHSDVSSEHLADFSCEVCDCEPCGTLSTFHSTSGETRNDASTNVPSRRTKKNQTVSAEIARTNG